MQFKRKLLSSSIALALAGGVSPVVVGDESVIEEVVVTGIRGSLKRSMDVKRDAMGVVDAISAEEMGKFPDANLAESLQRITGVSISRTRGEGSQVTVRGFGPEYNLVTLNGRQMPTHNGASRSFDFGDLASEGVAGVQVYKTGRADVPSGGVGSTINISTPRPLKGPPTASIAVKAVRDTSTRTGDEITPEISGVYVDQFADNTIGIALIGSTQKRSNGVNSVQIGGWYTRPGDDIVPNGSVDSRLANDANQINRPQTAGESYSLPQSIAYNVAEYESDRVNGQLVLQWAPIDFLTVTLDYIRSEFTLERSYSDLSAWFSNTAAVSQSSEWTNGPIASPVYYSEVVNNADFAMGTGEDGRTNTNESTGLNLEWQFNDNLVLAFDYHDSSAETGANTPNGTSANIAMATFNKVGQTIYTGPDLPVLELNLNSGGEVDRPMYKDDMVITGSVFSNDAAWMDVQQAKASGNWFFDDGLTSIDFGVQLSEVNNRSVSNFIQLNNWGGVTDPGALSDIVVRSSTAGQFNQLSGGSDPRLQTEFFTASLADLQRKGEEDYVASGATYEAVGDCGTGYCASTDWPNDIRTLEESTAAYVRFNWGGEIGVMQANVHAGIRYEETDVTSSALSILYDGSRWSKAGNELFVTEAKDASGNTVSGFEEFKGNYDLVLPSIDFDIEIIPNVIARASYSETVTRPSYNDIKGGLTASSTQYRATVNAQASAGNPGLVPIQSKNIDLSVEWYYADDSYFSFGYFEKDVENFIGSGLEEDTLFEIPNIIGGALWDRAIAESGLSPANYTEVGRYILDNFQSDPAVDGDTIVGVAGDPSIVWTLTRPVNQKTAKVDGIEVNLQHNFGESGYGFIANATFANADVGYDNTRSLEGQFVLNGLSDSANVVAFYDKDGLQVRLAYNWRDSFLAGAGQGQGTLTNPTNTKAYGQLDIGITYEASDDLTIFFSGLNVTESTVHVYGLTEGQVLQAVQGGARYDFGIRYTM